VKKLSVARRYAKALLILGKDDKRAEKYGEELDGFAQLLAKEKGLEQVLCNPLHGVESRKKVLQAVLKKLKPSKVVNSFILLVFDKGRLDFIQSINELYQKLADELKGVVRASVVSATAMSSEAVKKIQKALSKLTGKDVTIEAKQDPALIGGVVTTIGDLVLDGSIKTQLLSMKESLKRGESI